MLPLLAAAAVVAAATGAVRSDPELPYVSFVLGATVGLFGLALNRALWVLAPLLLVEFALGSYIVTELGMSARLAVTGAALALTAGTLISRAQIAFWDRHARRVLLPSLAFFALVFVGNAMHSGLGFTLKYLRYEVVLLGTLALVLAHVRDVPDLIRLARAVVVLGTVTATLAVWQHYDSGSALYGSAAPADVAHWKGRSLGLAASPVVLAVQASHIAVPLGAMFLFAPKRAYQLRALLLVSAGVTALGMYFSYTRSAVLAAWVGVGVVGLLSQRWLRGLILSALAVSLVMFLVLQNTGLVGRRYYRTAEDDRSAATHEGLLVAGLALVASNPITGMGHEGFEEASLEVASSLGDGNPAVGVGHNKPHNDFLNVWISWGIAAFLAYLAIFAGAFLNFARAARASDWHVRGLAIGCAGGLMAYMVNSALHNNLDSSVTQWMFFGLSAVLARLAATSPVAGLGPHLSALHDAALTRRRRLMGRRPRHSLARRPRLQPAA